MLIRIASHSCRNTGIDACATECCKNVGLCDVQYYSYLGKGFYINIIIIIIIIIIIMRLYIVYVTVLHRCIITSLRLSVSSLFLLFHSFRHVLSSITVRNCKYQV